MAGKRYDQYQIANSEAQSTDYKRFPQDSHGQTGDLEAFTEGDKQRLAESKKDAEGQPFPPDVPAPSVHAREGEKVDEDQPGAADTEPGKGNPAV